MKKYPHGKRYMQARVSVRIGRQMKKARKMRRFIKALNNVVKTIRPAIEAMGKSVLAAQELVNEVVRSQMIDKYIRDHFEKARTE